MRALVCPPLLVPLLHVKSGSGRYPFNSTRALFLLPTLSSLPRPFRLIKIRSGTSTFIPSTTPAKPLLPSPYSSSTLQHQISRYQTSNKVQPNSSRSVQQVSNRVRRDGILGMGSPEIEQRQRGRHGDEWQSQDRAGFRDSLDWTRPDNLAQEQPPYPFLSPTPTILLCFAHPRTGRSPTPANAFQPKLDPTPLRPLLHSLPPALRLLPSALRSK